MPFRGGEAVQVAPKIFFKMSPIWKEFLSVYPVIMRRLTLVSCDKFLGVGIGLSAFLVPLSVTLLRTDPVQHF